MITNAGQGYTSPPMTASVVTGGTASCSGTGFGVTTALGGALDLLTAVQPVTPSSGHGRTWFDNANDWPWTVPMGVDNANNVSAMVRVLKGTAVGTYTPIYSSVGGATPASTWTVYNNTASTFPVTGASTPVAITVAGPYTGYTQVTYCVQIYSASTFEWGTGGSCTTNGPFALTGSGSPYSLGSGLTVYFSVTSGATPGQNWTILATPGGSTNEVIQAGIAQNGNLWQVENNAGTTQWWAVNPTGGLQGSAGGGTVTIQPQASSSTYALTLPANAGNQGQVLASGGSSSPTAWGNAATSFGSNGQAYQVSGSTTAYMASGVPSAALASAGIAISTWAVPVTCTLRDFYVYTLSPQPASGALVFTIYDQGTTPNTSSGTDTFLTVMFTSGTTNPQSDTSDSYTVAAGHALTVWAANAATGSSGKIGPWGVMCEPN